MKTFIFLSILISSAAYSQTIIKVDGAKVTVNGASSFKEGVTVNFLDSDLNTKAMGIVEKVSPQGTTAIVKVTSGTAHSNYTVEKSEQEETHSQTTRTKELGTLSKEDQEILDRGEIGTAAYVIGGVLGTYPLGFGIGHAIQGRYSSKGWIFTVGELGSVALIASGFTCGYSGYTSSYYSCSLNGLASVGIIGLMGFKVWEIVDLWLTPVLHNSRYQQLRSRGYKEAFVPLLTPTNDGFIAGFQYHF